ncbi:MAG: DUF1304 domain-containing protein [Cellulomonadaceae bacterium]
MIVAALSFAVLAALLHVYIFVLESLTWTGGRARATFGLSAEEAAATEDMAFNQGFYNLFLAITAAAGVVLTALGQTGAGAALVLAGAGSMAGAATVLFASAPTKRRAALTQGALPLLAVVLLVLGLVL